MGQWRALALTIDSETLVTRHLVGRSHCSRHGPAPVAGFVTGIVLSFCVR